MKRVIKIGDNTVEYAVVRKKVKNINLRIRPDGEITVSANRFVSEKTIREFIISKYPFILNALSKYKALENAAPESGELLSGDKLMFCGKELTLSVTEGKNAAEISDGYFKVFVDDVGDYRKKQKIICKFYSREGERVITNICREMYPFFENSVKRFPDIKFRNMKTRWGICRPGRCLLTFNTRLILLPLPLIEYVVAHEFTHFSAPDHSARFYAELETVIPDRRQREKEIKKYTLFDFPK